MSNPVTPAKAGVSARKRSEPFPHEIPAFAGMTE